MSAYVYYGPNERLVYSEHDESTPACFRLTPFAEEVQRYVSDIRSDLTRAVVSLVIAAVWRQ